MSLRIRGSFAASLLACCVAAFISASPASASFTRSFVRQITRAENTGGKLNTEACSEAQRSAAGSTCLQPSGVAVDSGENLWVADARAGGMLDEFEPAAAGNLFSTSFAPASSPHAVAVESAVSGNGDIYVADGDAIEVYEPDGTHVETWKQDFRESALAIDNSPESLEDTSGCTLGQCDIYVETLGQDSSLEKLNSKGEAQSFECSTAACGEYIEGHTKITGVPGNPHSGGGLADGESSSVAVDAAGDIYAIGNAAVYEYKPSGEYVREFIMNREGSEVPRICSGEESASPKAVAIDPVSGNLVVTAGNGYPAFGLDDCGAIVEFSTATGKFASIITREGEDKELGYMYADAVDSAGDLYAVDISGGLIDVWSRGAYDPTVSPGPATGRNTESAVLTGSVDPAQHGNEKQTPDLQACYFEWVSEEEFDQNVATHGGKESEGFASLTSGGTAECSPDANGIPSEPEVEHQVQAAIHGLVSGTIYRYRLVAASGGENGGTAHTKALAFIAPVPPEVIMGSSVAENVSSTYADLHAQIKPEGEDTSYFFEYGTSTAYGADAPAPPGAAIGSGGATGGAVESVMQHVGPLQPGTEYHFRVVAENTIEGETEITYGPDETFATVPAEVSSERGYELVTPAQKEGGADLFAKPLTNGEYSNDFDVGVAAESGDAFLFDTKSAFGSFPASGESRYVFRREPAAGRWSYESLSDPALGPQSLGAMPLFEPGDFARVALVDTVGTTLGAEGERDVDLLGAPGGPYTTLHEGPPYHRGETGLSYAVETQPVGASRDLSHVVLETQSGEACGHSETGAKVTHGDVLCEWDGQYETLEDGEVVPKFTFVNLAPESESEPASACGAVLGYGDNGLVGGGDKRFAVSADGAKVFFTAPDPTATGRDPQLEGKEGCWKEGSQPKNAPQLYMRAGGETIEVSAPEEGVSLSASRNYGAQYVGASEDGSRVYFLSESELTANDAGIHELELYEYDTETHELTRISAGESGHEAGGVGTIYAIAADGTAVYFSANGVLAANEGPDGSHASPGDCEKAQGSCNLYRYQPASGGAPAKINFVSVVNEEDTAHTGSGKGVVPSGEDLRAYTTPDGRYLLFDTREDITGYSTAGCIADSEQCMELYRYDAQAAQDGRPAIVCVSCDPSGAPPVSNAFFERSINGGGGGYEPVRAMSNNGEYVFFDSADPLAPGASNGTLNTFEWHDGAISPIGSGSDASPTYFLGYAPNPQAHSEEAREGGNVFVGTHAQLTSQDTNGFGEIYDARVCESQSPCIEPPPGETVQCEGSSCQAPAIAPPEPTQTLLEPPASVMSSPGTAIKSKGLTRAQKLQKALKACRGDRKHKTRLACEKRAHDSYGAVAKRGRASRTRRSGGKGGRR